MDETTPRITSILRVPRAQPSALVDWVARLERLAASERVALAAGETLFAQGDTAVSVYVVVSGRLAVCKQLAAAETITLAHLTAGDLVGEMEVWTGQARPAAVVAESETHLVQVPAHNFKRLLEANPVLRQAVADVALPRIRNNQLAVVLPRIFGYVDPAMLEDVRAQVVWRYAGNGTLLFRQGDAAGSLFIVVNGRLRRLYRDEQGQDHVVGEVGAGEVVGELGLLSERPRATSVVAVRETILVEVTRPLFEQLWQRYPQAMLPLTRALVRGSHDRLTVLNRRAAPPVTVALTPTSPDVDVVAFARRLAQSLEAHGRILVLDRAQCDARYGRRGAADMPPDHPAHPLLVSWLNDLEAEYEHILYVADATWTEWTRRCIRQADRVLLLANAAHDPAPTLLEEAIEALALPVRTELVLWHGPQVERPSGTARWLAPRRVATYHHVRGDAAAHYGRLARRLTGNAVALALSGGGARGYAHLGVFRALQERGVAIDMIGGTSMGGLLAAAIAMDWPYETILALSHQFANPRALFDYTLPLVSLMASEKLTTVVRDNLGEATIEDLWRPFFAVSTNLTRAETVVHRDGPLWHAVRATISIPGLFAPVSDGHGDVLVDGGLMNNFPADVMRDLVEGGQIIGVALDHGARRESYDFEPAVSGWRVLRRRLSPFTESLHVPSLAGLLMRSAMINSTQQVNLTRQQTDLLIEPNVSGYGLLDFADYREIIELGYAAAVGPLTAWLARRQKGGRSSTAVAL